MSIELGPRVRRVMPDEPLAWRGPAGVAYAERNPSTVAALDAAYARRFGITRSELVHRFLRYVPRSASVLEVGVSTGVQLAVLRACGYTGRMAGVDVARDPLADCAEPCAAADGCALPFPPRSFDLVFTSGTLMHVPFNERAVFCREVLRVARRWVWGMEPWSDPPAVINFYGLVPNAWAQREPETYTQLEPGLHVLDQVWWPRSPYTHSMWILERR